MSERWRGTLAPLLVSTTAYYFGEGIRATLFALSAAALTRNPTEIAMLQVIRFIPPILFGLPAAVLVDRRDRRRTFARVQAAAFTIMAAMTAATLMDALHLWMLYVAAFGVAMCELLTDITAQSFVPALAPRDRLEWANGRMVAASVIAGGFLAPPLAGSLATMSLPVAFAVVAISFGVARALTTFLPASIPAPRPLAPSLLSDIRVGLIAFWEHRTLRALGVMVAVINFGYGMYNGTMVLFSLEVLGLEEVEYGLLSSAYAVGAVIGSMIASRLVLRFGRERAMMWLVIMHSGTVLLIGVSSLPVVVGGLIVLSGLVQSSFAVMNRSIRQTLPPELIARVIMSFRLVAFAAIPLGALMGGTIAQAFGLRAPFLVAGVLIALAGTIGGSRLRAAVV